MRFQIPPTRTSALSAFVVLAIAVAIIRGSSEEAPRLDTAAAAALVAVRLPAAPTGEQAYERCAPCHQMNGRGLAGVFPPLAGSEYATAANVSVPIRVVTRGMQGPVRVKGAEYIGLMPAYGTGAEMTNDEVARVLTYVRQSWGNNASAVTAEDVVKERAAQTTKAPVTAAELKPLM